MLNFWEGVQKSSSIPRSLVVSTSRIRKQEKSIIFSFGNRLRTIKYWWLRSNNKSSKITSENSAGDYKTTEKISFLIRHNNKSRNEYNILFNIPKNFENVYYCNFNYQIREIAGVNSEFYQSAKTISPTHTQFCKHPYSKNTFLVQNLYIFVQNIFWIGI